MHSHNDDWTQWDNEEILTATKLAMRAFPCTVRNMSPIQCLTGRIPKVDASFDLSASEEFNDQISIESNAEVNIESNAEVNMRTNSELQPETIEIDSSLVNSLVFF